VYLSNPKISPSSFISFSLLNVWVPKFQYLSYILKGDKSLYKMIHISEKAVVEGYGGGDDNYAC
jgi:hypothetical protein